MFSLFSFNKEKTHTIKDFPLFSIAILGVEGRRGCPEEISPPFFPRGFPNVYTVMPADYDYHSNEIGDYIKTVSSVSKSNCKHSGYNTKL